MGTKIIFPYLCRYKKQWNELLSFLGKKGVCWASGKVAKAGDFTTISWKPTYLIYDFNSRLNGSTLYYYTCDENTTIEDVFSVCFRKNYIEVDFGEDDEDKISYPVTSKTSV